MLPSFRRALTAPRSLSALVLGLSLAALLAVAPQPVATASSGTAVASVRAAGIPMPGDDLGRPPERCFEDNVVVSPCRVTSYPRRPWLVVWGDSHAQMYFPALRRLSVKNEVNLVMLLAGSCPVSRPFPRSADKPYAGCDRHNDESFAYVRDLADRGKRVHVLVNSFWSGYRRHYELMQREEQGGPPSGVPSFHQHMAELAVERSPAMMRRLDTLGIPVDFVAQAATVPYDARRCARGEDPYQCPLPRRRALSDEAGNSAFIARLAGLIEARTSVVDPSDLYCGPLTCYAHVEGVNTYYDHAHLGKRLASKTGPWFRPVLRATAAGR